MKPFMPDNNDRELDDLFRKAAADYTSAPAGKEETAEKEAVWKKLEAQLDASAQGARRRTAGWRILSLTLLFIIILAGVLIWKKTEKRAAPQTQHLITVQPEKRKTSSANGKERNNSLSGSTASSTESKKKTERTTDAVSATGLISQTVVRSVPILNDHKKKSKTKREEKKGGAAHAIPGRLQQLSSLPTSFSRGKTGSILSKGTAADIPNTGRQIKEEPSGPKGKDVKEEGFHHWSLGFTAGPEWSGVKTHGWRTGVAGGLKITYRFNPQWAVSTGILLTRKLYDAPPSDYHPADSRWRNYDVKQIGAQCIVWDVPLNVAYTLWRRQGNRIFLSTGLSSFWMHEEKYTYHYKTAAGSWKEWDKELYNQNQHLFSILNFSAGYEKNWPHFSLQVSPYLKVPLKGIGYGKVKLYGAGLHFTLQYGLR